MFDTKLKKGIKRFACVVGAASVLCVGGPMNDAVAARTATGSPCGMAGKGVSQFEVDFCEALRSGVSNPITGTNPGPVIDHVPKEGDREPKPVPLECRRFKKCVPRNIAL